MMPYAVLCAALLKSNQVHPLRSLPQFFPQSDSFPFCKLHYLIFRNLNLSRQLFMQIHSVDFRVPIISSPTFTNSFCRGNLKLGNWTFKKSFSSSRLRSEGNGNRGSLLEHTTRSLSLSLSQTSFPPTLLLLGPDLIFSSKQSFCPSFFQSFEASESGPEEKKKAAIGNTLFLRIRIFFRKGVKRENQSGAGTVIKGEVFGSSIGRVSIGRICSNTGKNVRRRRRRSGEARVREWGGDDERPEAEAEVDGGSSRSLCGCRH